MSSIEHEPVAAVDTDLSRILRELKLSGLKDTTPGRVVIVRTWKMGHAAFPGLILADEPARRNSRPAMLRAQRANLDHAMPLETWEGNPETAYDRVLPSDPLLTQPAIYRPARGTHTLVIERPSIWQRDTRHRTRTFDEMRGE